ncbi:MAG: disulfide bond formation protein B [Acidobacteria bacterium]|nr:MAG: disulfide bond formation protein B [Acidobacteriota bacterium]
MSLFFAALTVAANAAVVATLLLAIASRFSDAAQTLLERAREALADSALPLAWLVALVATLGSLYYSEIAHYTPCKLCWFQRILMYPMALILGIASLRKDYAVKWYIVPLAVIGPGISIYHYWLQRFPPDAGSAFCTPEAPCTATWVWKFGYISIPFMALSAFTLILALMYLAPSARTETGED